MLTRSIAKTPYGFRLTYDADGERMWTEYIPFAVFRGTESAGPIRRQRQSSRIAGLVRRMMHGALQVSLRGTSDLLGRRTIRDSASLDRIESCLAGSDSFDSQDVRSGPAVGVKYA